MGRRPPSRSRGGWETVRLPKNRRFTAENRRLREIARSCKNPCKSEQTSIKKPRNLRTLSSFDELYLVIIPLLRGGAAWESEGRVARSTWVLPRRSRGSQINNQPTGGYGHG